MLIPFTKALTFCLFVFDSPINVVTEPSLLASPVTSALFATVQVYVVPAGTTSVPFVGVTENSDPEQIVAVLAAITGVGFTVIVAATAVVAEAQAPLLTTAL